MKYVRVAFYAVLSAGAIRTLDAKFDSQDLVEILVIILGSMAFEYWVQPWFQRFAKL